MMWDVDKLKQYFARQGIPEHYFGLYEDKDDAFCIAKEGGEWLVYFSERGERRELGWGKKETQGLDILRLYVIEEFKLM